MRIESIIEDLQHNIAIIWRQGRQLPERLFALCPRCKRRIIESIVEEKYCFDYNVCKECRPISKELGSDAIKLIEAIHLSTDVPLQRFFRDRLARKTLIAVLDGILSGGPRVPCVFPQICSFELTYRCNLRCKHCYIGTPPVVDEVNTACASRIIENIAEAGFVGITLSGGEPLMRKDLLTLVRQANMYGMEVIISTNGTLLSGRIRELKRYVDLFCISLDSHEESVNDNFRGVDGAYRATLKGIEECLANDLRVRVFTTLTKSIYQVVPEFVSFVEGIGVKEIAFFDLNPVGRGLDTGSEYRLSVNEYRTAVSVLGEIANRSSARIDVLAPFNLLPANTEYLNPLTLLSGGFCNAGISTLNISPDGNVQPCSRLRVNLGNAIRGRIRDIWTDSPILIELRDRTKIKGTCGECEYKHFCGGCRANAYSQSKDYLMEDFRCLR